MNEKNNRKIFRVNVLIMLINFLFQVSERGYLYDD